MDAKTFHGAFANSLSKEDAAAEFEGTATHDSCNILRGCMGPDGRDVDTPHGPLLLIGGEKDEIIPEHLTKKNFMAYSDKGRVTEFQPFAGRHNICNDPAGKKWPMPPWPSSPMSPRGTSATPHDRYADSSQATR